LTERVLIGPEACPALVTVRCDDVAGETRPRHSGTDPPRGGSGGQGRGLGPEQAQWAREGYVTNGDVTVSVADGYSFYLPECSVMWALGPAWVGLEA